MNIHKSAHLSHKVPVSRTLPHSSFQQGKSCSLATDLVPHPGRRFRTFFSEGKRQLGLYSYVGFWGVLSEWCFGQISTNCIQQMVYTFVIFDGEKKFSGFGSTCACSQFQCRIGRMCLTMIGLYMCLTRRYTLTCMLTTFSDEPVYC